MSQENLIFFLASIPVGIVSGLYSGLIVARYQRFSDVRSQVLRMIREIDFIDEGSRINFTKRKEVGDLTLLASDLFHLKHKHAAMATLQIRNDINEDLHKARYNQISYNELELRCRVWQDAGRELKPSARTLLRLWSGL